MRIRVLDVLAAAALGVAAVLAVVGLLHDGGELFALGGAFATAGSLLIAWRLRQWARGVSLEQRRMRDWEFRPGYLTAVLVAAVILALMFVEVGRLDIAAWSIPAAMAWFLLAMSRGRLNSLFHDLLFPTQTPPRRQ